MSTQGDAGFFPFTFLSIHLHSQFYDKPTLGKANKNALLSMCTHLVFIGAKEIKLSGKHLENTLSMWVFLRQFLARNVQDTCYEVVNMRQKYVCVELISYYGLDVKLCKLNTWVNCQQSLCERFNTNVWLISFVLPNCGPNLLTIIYYGAFSIITVS